jgi:hypothetical protein
VSTGAGTAARISEIRSYCFAQHSLRRSTLRHFGGAVNTFGFFGVEDLEFERERFCGNALEELETVISGCDARAALDERVIRSISLHNSRAEEPDLTSSLEDERARAP